MWYPPIFLAGSSTCWGLQYVLPPQFALASLGIGTDFPPYSLWSYAPALTTTIFRYPVFTGGLFSRRGVKDKIPWTRRFWIRGLLPTRRRDEID
jgi:hypothetical protein